MTAEAEPMPRLLIADDSEDMRWLVRSTVGAQFGDVAEAADGRELLWLLMRSTFAPGAAPPPPSVVIADVCMPIYDGLDVLDAWQEGTDKLAVIVITAFPDDEVRAKAERLGAVLLAKPFSRAALRRAVADVILRVQPAR